jgi:hypothetical protein
MRFREKVLYLALALVASAFLGSTALAQEVTGGVEGVVLDSSGATVPGAAVKIEGGSTSRTSTTDTKGRYMLAQVPPGVYKVSATLPGFGPGVAERVTVAIGKAVTVNFTLKVGGMAEEVTVTGDLRGIDTATTTIQTNVTTTTIESLPKGTQMGDLLKLAPAARGEANSGGTQIDGASGSENSFMIDGLETSNFRTGTLNTNNNLPFALIAEMQVKTSGFNAEFGGATGGVISVVTKSGTNDFRGTVGLDYAPSSLQGDPREALYKFRSGSGASTIQLNEYLPYKKDDFKQYYPVFALGGPVKRDRAWFFVSYSPQRYTGTRTTEYYTTDPRTRKLTATQPYDRTTTGQYLQGRLDVQASNSLRISAGYIWNPYSEDGLYPHSQINLGGSPPSANFGGSTGTLTGNTLTSQQGGKQDGHNVSLNATWTPNNRIIGNAKVARGFLNEMLNSEMIPQLTRFRCVSSAPPSSAGCTVGFDTLPSGNTQKFNDASVRWIADASLGFFVDNLAGRHEFKAGYQFSKVTNEVDSGYVPYGRIDLSYNYTINDLTGRNDPVTPGAIGAGQAIRFGTIGKASNTAHSIYLQDTWKPTSRLTINAGVRLEKEDLPSFNGFAPPISFGFFDKWVPRLGVAYDITGDGRTKAFASFNRFQDRLKFELPRGSFGGDFYRIDYFEIMPSHPEYTYYTLERVLGNNKDVLGGTCPIVNPTGGLTRCQYDYRIASNNPEATIYDGAVDPNMKPFTQTEWSGGFERELMSNLSASVRYVHKQVDWAIEDAGFPTPEGSEAYIIGNPGSGLHAETAKLFGYAKTTKPERKYDALEFKLDRRFAKNFSLSLAYTYSKLRGNYSGLASSDEAGRTSPGVNRFFDLPHLGFTAAGTSDSGPLATDRPHVFNAYGGYDLKWGGSQTTHFSFFTTAQSGVPRTSFYTLYAAAVLYGRNNLGRTPMFTNTDLMLSHQVRFGRRQSLTFEFNVLNLFDEKNTLGLADNPGYVNPSISTLKLPPSVTNEPEAINYVLTNGIVSNYDAFLNDPANPQRKDTALGMASAFQGPRAVRLAVRFSF